MLFEKMALLRSAPLLALLVLGASCRSATVADDLPFSLTDDAEVQARPLDEDFRMPLRMTLSYAYEPLNEPGLPPLILHFAGLPPFSVETQEWRPYQGSYDLLANPIP